MSLMRFALPLIFLAAVACSPAAPGGSTSQTAANPNVAATTPVSCDAPAQPLAIGASAHGDIPAARNYPDNARYFCISVGEGVPTLTVEVSGMATDLDLYMGHGSIASVQGINLQNGDNYEWKSNAFGTDAERVVIDHPAAGIYYAEIVSYQGQASGFDVSAR